MGMGVPCGVMEWEETRRDTDSLMGEDLRAFRRGCHRRSRVGLITEAADLWHGGYSLEVPYRGRREVGGQQRDPGEE